MSRRFAFIVSLAVGLLASAPSAHALITCDIYKKLKNGKEKKVYFYNRKNAAALEFAAPDWCFAKAKKEGAPHCSEKEVTQWGYRAQANSGLNSDRWVDCNKAQ